MELERTRSSLDAERAQIRQLLADLGTARTDDHDAERDATYPVQPLAPRGADDAAATGLTVQEAADDQAADREPAR